MGTETIVTIFNHNLVTLFVVKLSNPQMGTETVSVQWSFSWL